MLEFFQKLFVSNDFMPHGHCYLWQTDIIWLHVISDGIIVLAYYSIPLMLIYFVRKRRDVPFHWLFLMFGAFIFACGTTHLLNIWTIWVPAYRFEGLVKLITAVISLATALFLIPVIPKALEMPTLERSNEKLRKTAAALARSNKDLEQFAYVASHDLREPLRMVTGFVQLLEAKYEGKLDREADEYIQQIVSGTKRMHSMIEDLLAYSRVTTQEGDFKEVEMTQVLEEVRSNLTKVIEETGTIVEADPLPALKVDRFQMIQLFQNLIGNAIKFCGDKKPLVHISAEKRQDEWVFSVRDNGIGFDNKYAQQIFEIFQRLHSREKYEGSGIGLSVCKRIVERHGGRIWAESKPGEGSVFCFSLPLSE